MEDLMGREEESEFDLLSQMHRTLSSQAWLPAEDDPHVSEEDISEIRSKILRKCHEMKLDIRIETELECLGNASVSAATPSPAQQKERESPNCVAGYFDDDETRSAKRSRT